MRMNNNKWIVFIVLWLTVLSLLIGCTPTNQQLMLPKSNDTSEQLQIHFVDVGQGAAQLIIGPTGKTMLIDGGDNDQESVIVDYLNKQDIQKIDILVGTHPHADHIGGLDAVIDHYDIGQIYMPRIQSNTRTFEDVLKAIQRKGLKVTTAKAGLELDWEADVEVRIVAPVEVYEDANEMSAVLHITYDNVSFLLTGDAGEISEEAMIHSKVDLNSDVLMVGHHGSSSSTSQAFIDAVKPTYAVIQVGQDNSYGHPKADVLKRLANNKVDVFRNDQLGDIIFTTNGKDITVSDSRGMVNNRVEKKSEIDQEAEVIYNNCAAVRAAGKAPLHRGEPGYSSKLDGDNDGVACEYRRQGN